MKLPHNILLQFKLIYLKVITITVILNQLTYNHQNTQLIQIRKQNGNKYKLGQENNEISRSDFLKNFFKMNFEEKLNNFDGSLDFKKQIKFKWHVNWQDQARIS